MPDEYIRRDAAMKACRSPAQNRMIDEIRNKIRRMPAADVAEVARCKDCRHSKYAAWCEGYACCRTVGEYHHADFGCTDGELQTNGVAE